MYVCMCIYIYIYTYVHVYITTISLVHHLRLYTDKWYSSTPIIDLHVQTFGCPTVLGNRTTIVKVGEHISVALNRVVDYSIYVYIYIYIYIYIYNIYYTIILYSIYI